MFLGCILGKDSQDILLLQSSQIFNGAELKSLTQGHRTLYKAFQHNKGKMSAGKKTNISFQIENLYAVGIEEVREIIDCPEKLLQPPGLPPSFKGILNLRNELVNIVDAVESIISFGESETTLFIVNMDSIFARLQKLMAA